MSTRALIWGAVFSAIGWLLLILLACLLEAVMR